MKCDSYSCIGESHIASGKPCQDRSLHWCDDKSGVSIVIVCDGHGGDRYFRSDIGAELLCKVTKEALLSFASTIQKRNKKLKNPLFKGRPFTQVPTVRESQETLPRQSAEDEAINQLLSSIVAQWREKIDIHASETPLSEWELSNVDSNYLIDFEQRRNIEKNYGSTLIAYLQTNDYWLAIHLGDGKCIMFDSNDECLEPVLWDEKCFLNRTTSICDPAPIDEFRYSFRGDGDFPAAIFIGSDGIDDSYGDGERLHGFYLNVLRLLASEGGDSVHKSLEESLPVISRRGSRDDMSIAFVYDENSVKEHACNLTKKQIGMLDIEFAELKDKARAKKRTVDEFAGEYERKRASLRKGDTKSAEFKACEKLRINLKYADSEHKGLLSQLESLKKQAISLYDFLGITPPEKAYEIDDSEPNYLARITSFIDGSFGKECDEAVTTIETAELDSSNSDVEIAQPAPEEVVETVDLTQAEDADVLRPTSNDGEEVIETELTTVAEGVESAKSNVSTDAECEHTDTLESTAPKEEDVAPSSSVLEDIKRVLDEAVKPLTAVIMHGKEHKELNKKNEETDSDSTPGEV